VNISRNETYHVPVLLKESVDGLGIVPGGIYVDVTFGGGGHSREILSRMDGNGHLYSFDQDADAERNLWFGERREERGERREKCPSPKNLSRIEDGGWRIENSSIKNADIDESGDEKQQSISPSSILNPQSSKDTPLSSIPNFTFVRSNFRFLKNWMRYYGVEKIDGLLADLGVSSHHFDDKTRGFSFRFDAPLDMRMNKRSGRTAADILNTADEEELANVFYLYGELKNSRRIAAAIVKARTVKAILTTNEFLGVVEPLFRKEREKKEMAKLFQALRIEVNQEMTALKEMLLGAAELLRPGGRLSVITYHSLEDRIVKNIMKSGNAEGRVEQDFFGRTETPFKMVNKVTLPTAEEQERNPRSRSAKLRIAEKKQ